MPRTPGSPAGRRARGGPADHEALAAAACSLRTSPRWTRAWRAGTPRGRCSGLRRWRPPLTAAQSRGAGACRCRTVSGFALAGFFAAGLVHVGLVEAGPVRTRSPRPASLGGASSGPVGQLLAAPPSDPCRCRTPIPRRRPAGRRGPLLPGMRSGCDQTASRPSTPRSSSRARHSAAASRSRRGRSSSPTRAAKVCSAGPPVARRRRIVSRSAAAWAVAHGPPHRRSRPPSPRSAPATSPVARGPRPVPASSRSGRRRRREPRPGSPGRAWSGPASSGRGC